MYRFEIKLNNNLCAIKNEKMLIKKCSPFFFYKNSYFNNSYYCDFLCMCRLESSKELKKYESTRLLINSHKILFHIYIYKIFTNLPSQINK
jgi:hypothetical protein